MRRCDQCVHFGCKELSEEPETFKKTTYGADGKPRLSTIEVPGGSDRKKGVRMFKHYCKYIKKAKEVFPTLKVDGESMVPNRLHVIDADGCPRFAKARSGQSPGLCKEYVRALDRRKPGGRAGLTGPDDPRKPYLCAPDDSRVEEVNFPNHVAQIDAGLEALKKIEQARKARQKEPDFRGRRVA